MTDPTTNPTTDTAMDATTDTGPGPAKLRAVIARVAQQEDLNFLLTNRIPRRLATTFFGWFSRIENPLVRALSLRTWRLFCDVDLSDARTARFRSLHDCFVRELREGARPVDPDPAVLASPCDAILGAHGPVEGARVHQIKGFPYALADLVADASLAETYRDGTYATLRLTAGMYHHFHAPHDLTVASLTTIAGDTWNVNPIALRRVEALFCKNERAVIRTRAGPAGDPVTLVPVAAILVAGLRFRFTEPDFDPRHPGTRTVACGARLAKGEPMGWFEHGSTIVVLAPRGYAPCGELREGARLRAGQALMRRAVDPDR